MEARTDNLGGVQRCCCVGQAPTGTGLGKRCKEEHEKLLQAHQPYSSEQYRQAGNNRQGEG